MLLIDIKGFTSACAAMSASSVGEWVAAFYERVDLAAAAHGVSRVEVRGDCCVCVAGVEGAVPSRAFVAAAADAAASQATRMLAFASALHADLATLPAGPAGCAPATATRMGIATGEVSFLVGDSAAADAAPFLSVLGDAAAVAARMEALSSPGAAHVHRSTALKWAAEARQPPPATVSVDCGGRGQQPAAVYDCATGAFRPGRCVSDGGARVGKAGPPLLCRRASAHF